MGLLSTCVTMSHGQDRHYTRLELSESQPLRAPANNISSSDGVLSLAALVRLSVDAKFLMACKGLRLYSFGFLAVILVIYLQHLSLSLGDVGVLFTWTLLGDAALSLLLTSHADRCAA